MLTLIQIISILTSNEAKLSLEQWCTNIAQDNTEVYELADQLDCEYGIELTESQISSLIRVCNRGTYKLAFKLTNIEREYYIHNKND
jgi:hypothetical protein